MMEKEAAWFLRKYLLARESIKRATYGNSSIYNFQQSMPNPLRYVARPLISPSLPLPLLTLKSRSYLLEGKIQHESIAQSLRLQQRRNIYTSSKELEKAVSENRGPASKSNSAHVRKPGWGGKQFVIFLLLHLIPIGGAYYMLQQLMNKRKREGELLNVSSTQELLTVCSQILKRNNSAFCIIPGERFPESIEILPHLPEDAAIILPKESLIAGVKDEGISNALLSKRDPFTLPLNLIHFALPASSVHGKYFLTDLKNKATLMYQDNDWDASVLVQGVVNVVTDEQQRDYYWSNKWRRFFPEGDEAKEYLLLRFTPQIIIFQKHGCYVDSEDQVRRRPTLIRMGIEDKITWVISNDENAYR